MLICAACGGSTLKVCVFAHRQVDQNDKEKIGMGENPVRMIFRKVQDDVIDAPSKFKVPKTNFKGNGGDRKDSDLRAETSISSELFAITERQTDSMMMVMEQGD